MFEPNFTTVPGDHIIFITSISQEPVICEPSSRTSHSKEQQQDNFSSLSGRTNVEGNTALSHVN